MFYGTWSKMSVAIFGPMITAVLFTQCSKYFLPHCPLTSTPPPLPTSIYRPEEKGTGTLCSKLKLQTYYKLTGNGKKHKGMLSYINAHSKLVCNGILHRVREIGIRTQHWQTLSGLLIQVLES